MRLVQQWALLACMFSLPASAKPAPEAKTEVRSGQPWFDTSGELLNAHGAGILKVGHLYYMIGEKRTGLNVPIDPSRPNAESEENFAGFNCYSSPDLLNWSYVGVALAPQPGTRIDGRSPVERPKILYNDATRTYTMYMHQWAGDFTIGYATSREVCSGYTYRGDLLAASNQGDLGVFKDDDGTGYVLGNFGRIYRLAPDFASVEATYTLPDEFQRAEAPAAFKAGGTYFFLGSASSYWLANDNFYATAPSLSGPWTYRGLFAPEFSNTYHSQTTFVLKIEGKNGPSFMYMGDRWVERALPTSTYIWQPLAVSGTSLSLPFYPAWTPAADG